ncbi:hypothetical protein VTN00DRAFT_1895 [Thermoascus crustaceus]|uniref:uncharacterized protein n=1 Tax=Thermoascus crustaceus TaxID=5088 RepID=UPI003743DA19
MNHAKVLVAEYQVCDFVNPPKEALHEDANAKKQLLSDLVRAEKHQRLSAIPNSGNRLGQPAQIDSAPSLLDVIGPSDW